MVYRLLDKSAGQTEAASEKQELPAISYRSGGSGFDTVRHGGADRVDMSVEAPAGIVAPTFKYCGVLV